MVRWGNAKALKTGLPLEALGSLAMQDSIVEGGIRRPVAPGNSRSATWGFEKQVFLENQDKRMWLAQLNGRRENEKL